MSIPDIWYVLCDIRETLLRKAHTSVAMCAEDDRLFMVVRRGSAQRKSWKQGMVSMVFDKKQAVNMAHTILRWAETGEWCQGSSVDIDSLPDLGEGDFYL